MFSNLTPLVRNLIIINVVVFVGQQLIPPFTSCIQSFRGMEVPIEIGFTQLISLWRIDWCPFKPYQFFTYMFAHGSFLHIFFNMMALASLGPILESYWGDKKFLFFYLATGIGAGVIYAVANYFISADNAGSMLGASGAIYGILMAFGLTFPNMQISLFFIPIKAKYMVFVVGFLTYVMDRSGSVAHLAHFGGAFIAFIMISIWRSQGRDRGY